MKKCSKCKEIKDLTAFSNRADKKDGLDYYCRKCKSQIDAIWRQNNKEKKAHTDKKYRENNKERMRPYFAKYTRDRRRSSIEERLKNNLRRRLHKALKGLAKSDRTMNILGTDIYCLKAHIESLFQPGMTWDNYGKWHMDHKIPLASANSINDIERLFHYTNLQPLWAIDNIIKSDKILINNL